MMIKPCLKDTHIKDVHIKLSSILIKKIMASCFIAGHKEKQDILCSLSVSCAISTLNSIKFP